MDDDNAELYVMSEVSSSNIAKAKDTKWKAILLKKEF
jgi:hypothetical protein